MTDLYPPEDFDCPLCKFGAVREHQLVAHDRLSALAALVPELVDALATAHRRDEQSEITRAEKQALTKGRAALAQEATDDD